ncbi:hypothetical protein ICE98_00008 [Lactococcus lactis]|nr:hypothetical protein [Lactococcus lactis]
MVGIWENDIQLQEVQINVSGDLRIIGEPVVKDIDH